MIETAQHLRIARLTYMQSLELMHQVVATAMADAPTTRSAYEQTLVETINALMPEADAPPSDLLYFLANHPSCLTYDVAVHGDQDACDAAQAAVTLAALLQVVLYDLLYTQAMQRAPGND